MASQPDDFLPGAEFKHGLIIHYNPALRPVPAVVLCGPRARDANFLEIPDIPENFHAQEASWSFRVLTSFQNKRKKDKENARLL